MQDVFNGELVELLVDLRQLLELAVVLRRGLPHALNLVKCLGFEPRERLRFSAQHVRGERFVFVESFLQRNKFPSNVTFNIHTI